MADTLSPAPAGTDNAQVAGKIDDVKLYKLRVTGEGVTVGLPKDVCLALGMAPGTSFVAVRAVGPCLVITRATDIASLESRVSEADAEFERAIAAWMERKGGVKP
jgi:hypothetical protein